MLRYAAHRMSLLRKTRDTRRDTCSVQPSQQIFLLAPRSIPSLYPFTGFLRDTKKAVCAAASLTGFFHSRFFFKGCGPYLLVGPYF